MYIVEQLGHVRNFGGGGYTKVCYILVILLNFYVLQCNHRISEVSNRRTEVNLGIFTMNPTLISLHRRGVFRQPWFALASFTSNFCKGDYKSRE